MTGFNNNGGGGHLFSYNEIRDHKKNMIESFKKKGGFDHSLFPTDPSQLHL